MEFTARQNLKPESRTGHVAITLGDYMIIWGGYQNEDDLYTRYLPAGEVWLYHTETEKWHHCMCTVPPSKDFPMGTSGACAVAVNHSIYIFGGHTVFGTTNEIYKLDCDEWKWEHINIVEDRLKPSPRDKFVGWQYENKLYFFGGFGLPYHSYLNENGSFFVDSSMQWTPVRGWNDQLVVFDIDTNTWSNPRCRGSVPTPRAAHAATRVDNKVYLFGGRHDSNRLNDLYCLDMDTLTWIRILTEGECPCARSWHSLTAINDTHLFLYGGFSQDNTPLSDGWMFNQETHTWSQAVVPSNQPRLWHTACCSTHGEVLVFAGCCSNILSQDQAAIHSDEVLVFRFSPKSLLRQCIDQVVIHKDILKAEWPSLPKSLVNKLVMKLPAEDDEDNLSDQQGRTCVIS